MVFLACFLLAAAGQEERLPRDDGYRGIWYFIKQSGQDGHPYKYSGGFATYPQQHAPIAIHAPAAKKTFFVYGGRPREKNELLHMVSYYDHVTGEVPRPAILLNKKTDDAHDNPVLQIDDRGHLWIFSNSHGTGRPSFIHRSRAPYSIDSFERVLETNFSYGQPWHFPGRGFLFLHTRYLGGRVLHWMTSPDGVAWSEPRKLAHIAAGHYQISAPAGDRVATAFNYHPRPLTSDGRTNIYYLETADFGKTWRTVEGREVEVPLLQPKNVALVRDYESEKLLAYLKDLQFDAQGRPVILYLTSPGFAAGPSNDPRLWHTARWTGREWEYRPFTQSDSNYDYGSLYIEEDGIWQIIGTTEAGPQPYATGGEIAIWTSPDQGTTWKKSKTLTTHSARNHSYPRRPVNPHPDFYALWADGNARELSDSSLYFTDRKGEHVRRLPSVMTGDTAKPEIVR